MTLRIEAPLPVRQAMKHHWRYLVAPTGLPLVTFALTRFANLHREVLAIIFLVALLVAFVPVMWLLLSGKVRHSFLHLAMVLSMGSALTLMIPFAIIPSLLAFLG